MQKEFNEKHGIIPQTVKRTIAEEIEEHFPAIDEDEALHTDDAIHFLQEDKKLSSEQIDKRIKEYKKLMEKAAKELRYEEAAKFRDLMHRYEAIALNL